MFSQAFLLFLCLTILVLLFFVIRRTFQSFVKYRGLRVVTCPETKESVGVKVDAAYAALTSITDTPDLRLKACTRWPERHDCDQDCLLQIAANPEGTLYWNMMVNWYEGKACVYCATIFSKLEWSDRKTALMDAQHNLCAWLDVLPQQLPNTLATHQPVCWNCYIAESFRRQHPDLVVDRNYRNLKLS